MIKVVCGVIIDGKKVLLAQRSVQMEHPLKWEFPGGKMENDETPGEALKRELLEELNMNIHVNLVLKPVFWTYPEKEVKLIPLLCKWTGGAILTREHQQLKWCNWNELQNMDVLEADIAIVNEIERFL
ncbi:MAG: (deoxy)nucleoside triphosphate pyrophosphohydrolase [Owenweeksia sp.]